MLSKPQLPTSLEGVDISGFNALNVMGSRIRALKEVYFASGSDSPECIRAQEELIDISEVLLEYGPNGRVAVVALAHHVKEAFAWTEEGNPAEEAGTAAANALLVTLLGQLALRLSESLRSERISIASPAESIRFGVSRRLTEMLLASASTP